MTKTQSRHTPRPWMVDKAFDGKPIIFAPVPHFVVCQLAYERGQDDYGAFDNCEANARLIAAAPELLEALELVYRRMANDDKLQARLATGIKYGHERECEECTLFLDIQNLIAKAKGE